ncbi:cytochrome P450 [Flavisphingomonas formosensis]|uniref:cytochrome P450 n=1 Tax=Flavisphingomonas formosensis TaxID=861534 RepID=UPI0012FBF182|nr:cytochrome P450 [Sphingomonas formosensis]
MLQDLIDPLPPIAAEELDHVGAGLMFLDAPVDYLRDLRARHGDTFFVDLFGFRLLMTFAPKGLESLYRLEEDKASFGLATFDLLGFKTPSEIFADASTELFYDLLANRHVAGHVRTMTAIVDDHLAGWPDEGEIDLFDAVRTLEQRVGYALWIAPEAAAPGRWQALKAEFDILDQETAFVNPADTLATIRSGKARERGAVAAIRAIVETILGERTAHPSPAPAALDFYWDRFAEQEEAVRRRKTIHSAINVNQGFLSNLYAAIGWTLVNLVRQPAVRAKAEAEIAATAAAADGDFRTDPAALDRMAWLEQVTMESIRLAQTSITLRKVIAPVDFDDGHAMYHVRPGVYIATLLGVGNREGAEARRFDPDHFVRSRPAPSLGLPLREAMSTFGHGRHACPAQRFSHHMTKILVSTLLRDFEIEPCFAAAEPARRQIGGVARPENPARVRLRRRKGA